MNRDDDWKSTAEDPPDEDERASGHDRGEAFCPYCRTWYRDSLDERDRHSH